MKTCLCSQSGKGKGKAKESATTLKTKPTQSFFNFFGRGTSKGKKQTEAEEEEEEDEDEDSSAAATGDVPPAHADMILAFWNDVRALSAASAGPNLCDPSCPLVCSASHAVSFLGVLSLKFGCCFYLQRSLSVSSMRRRQRLSNPGNFRVV